MDSQVKFYSKCWKTWAQASLHFCNFCVRTVCLRRRHDLSCTHVAVMYVVFVYIYWSGELVSHHLTVPSLQNRTYQRVGFDMSSRIIVNYSHSESTWGLESVQNAIIATVYQLGWKWDIFFFFTFSALRQFMLLTVSNAVWMSDVCFLTNSRPFSSPLCIERNRHRGRTSLLQGFVWERTGMLQTKLYPSSLHLHMWPSMPPFHHHLLCNFLSFSFTALFSLTPTLTIPCRTGVLCMDTSVCNPELNITDLI